MTFTDKEADRWSAILPEGMFQALEYLSDEEHEALLEVSIEKAPLYVVARTLRKALMVWERVEIAQWMWDLLGPEEEDAK